MEKPSLNQKFKIGTVASPKLVRGQGHYRQHRETMCKLLVAILLIFHHHQTLAQQLPPNLQPTSTRPAPTFTEQRPSYTSLYYPNISITIAQLADANDAIHGLPEECRTDVCHSYMQYDVMKGQIAWPQTRLGVRRLMLCPYAYYEPLYATNDCTVAPNLTSHIWSNTNISACPPPPLSQYLSTISSAIHTTPWDFMNMPLESMYSWYDQVIDNLVGVITNYSSAASFPDNSVDITKLCDNAFVKLHNYTMPAKTISEVITLMDYVITPDRLLSGINALDVGTRTGMLRVITVGSSICDESYEVQTDSVYSRNQFITVSASSTLSNLSVSLPSLFTPINTSYTSSLTLQLHPTPSDVGDRLQLTIAAARTGYLLFDTIPVNVPIINTNKKQSARANDQGLNQGRLTTEVTNMLASSANGDVIKNSSDSLDNPDYYYDGETPQFRLSNYVFIITGPVVYVGVTPQVPLTVNLNLATGVDIADDSSSCIDVVCGQLTTSPEDVGNGGAWRLDTCKTTRYKNSAHKVMCSCQSPGFVGALCSLQTWSQHQDSGGKGSNSLEGRSTLEVFLGFPYNYQLNIFSHVTRALSLVCFVLTLLSYALFPKARRGQPTLLLLNLCVALLALLVLLYISERVASSMYGCRCANILRYYLILVSLMWNAAEAITMYLMFVRVFDSHISYLGIKAGAIAWGVPFFMIGFNFINNRYAFDGTYVNCSFACFLPRFTLLHGYLIPVVLIIAHNLIIFALVLPHICRRSNANVDKRKDAKMQLIGSVGLLFLLGVPWLFSVFGAISNVNSNDYQLSVSDGILETLFIIFVNSQGVFIFFFHCVRNADIRAEWRRLLTRVIRCGSATVSDCSGVTHNVTSGTSSSSGKDSEKSKSQYTAVADTSLARL